MTFDRIAAFGDSWVWGDELVDPQLPNATAVSIENTPYRESHCFVGQVGRQLNVTVENLAIPGGSLQSTIWNYLWWLNQQSTTDNVLVVVGLTDASRTSWYNPNHQVCENDQPWNRYVHSAWVKHTDCYNDNWQQLAKLHTGLSDCEKLWELNYQQAVWFFHGQSMTRPLLQFNVLNNWYGNWPSSLIWPDTNLRNLLRFHTNCWCNGRHPNELGHQIIAQALISQIESAIITRC